MNDQSSMQQEHPEQTYCMGEDDYDNDLCVTNSINNNSHDSVIDNNDDYDDDDNNNDESTRRHRRRFTIGTCVILAVFSLLGSVLVLSKTSFGNVLPSQKQTDTYSFDDITHGRRLQQEQNQQHLTSWGRQKFSNEDGSPSQQPSVIRLAVIATTVASYHNNDDHSSMAVARKQQHDVKQSALKTLRNDDSLLQVDSINYILGQKEQVSYVRDYCGNEASERMNELLASNKFHLAAGIVQWCALSLATDENTSANAALFLDAGSPIVLNSHPSDLFTYLNDYVMPTYGSSTDAPDVPSLPNMAVLGMESIPETIHGSFLLLRNTAKNHDLAQGMLKLLLSTDITFEAIEANAILLSQTLYALIQKQSQKEWYMLNHQCRTQPPKRRENESIDRALQDKDAHMFCPISSGYCCSIQDAYGEPLIVLMSRNLILPYQILNPSNIMVPYNHRKVKADSSVVADDELPYISSVSETLLPKPANFHSTPTFYEMLAAKKCLPEEDACSRCLREKRGADCHRCGSFCHCYCKALCNPDERPHAQHVAKKLTVTPPPYRRDPTRLIPRIVHQTWFEELTQSKYPNMSRLVQSFVRSGWEYKFYSDAQAGAFLSTHFPKEIREAYDALRPGAFKADLFRYCVLLIHGGVYADVDIQLESALDLAIAPDIGFMVPIDEPGKHVNHQMCLWNGLIAAAPGHPFLAKAIETIVNQVRNRFTSVDIDESFCEYHDDKDKIKSPELSVLHAYDTLFTAGPCLLGSSINRVLGRQGQTSFHPGELKGLSDKSHQAKMKQGTSFVIGIPEGAHDEHYRQARVPGRTVILHQNKWDMGAHRFTFVEENLVIAATDLPDSNDLSKPPSGEDEEDEAAENTPPHEHYSSTHAKTGVYGVHNLYTDREIAYEEIRIFVDASIHTRMFLKSSALIS